MRPIQTIAGHHGTRKIGTGTWQKSGSSLIQRVIRSFARDDDVMNVAFRASLQS